jgi:hypothetical protein
VRSTEVIDGTEPGSPSSTALVPGRLDALLADLPVIAMMVAATRLGIADRLERGPMTVAELARETSCHEPFLIRLLRALTALGFFKDRDGRLGLTPLGTRLRAHTFESLGGRLRLWSHLDDSVRTGETATERVFGATNWRFREDHPEADASFNAYMADGARAVGEALARRFRFPPGCTIVDVGGGTGALLSRLLGTSPGTRGVVFDQPHVVRRSEAELRAVGVEDRCELVGGDFFAGVPAGGDVYVLMRVLHDWSDDRCVEILASCRRAMSRGARLLIIERLLPEDGTPSLAHLSDLWMLLTNEGGLERSGTGFRALIARAGFRVESLESLAQAFVLECRVDGPVEPFGHR